MPYIPQKRRYDVIVIGGPETPGELNYLLTTSCIEYLDKKTNGVYNYTTINEIIGALECCKQEFYRRVAIPLEETAMSTNFELVQEFHEALGRPMPDKPALPHDNDSGHELIGLRLDLILEEERELTEALDERDIVKVADALADLLYVVYGAGVEFGIPMDKVFAEVHRSNMTKVRNPKFREDGKLLKGDGFEPPNIEPLLK